MVVYIVCFDLAESPQAQINQLNYWLNYLNSMLPLSVQSGDRIDSNWCILIAGLRSDLRSTTSSLPSLAILAQRYPRLAIMVDKLFTVSSTESIESVQALLTALEGECSRIFNTHCIQIPRSYRSILKNFHQFPSSHVLLPWKLLLQQQTIKVDVSTFRSALKYLHAIGHIVLLKNWMVCTNPSLIPQIAAKFVSPEEVQISLLKEEDADVQILDKKEIGCMLQIDPTDNARFFFLLHLFPYFLILTYLIGYFRSLTSCFTWEFVLSCTPISPIPSYTYSLALPLTQV